MQQHLGVSVQTPRPARSPDRPAEGENDAPVEAAVSPEAVASAEAAAIGLREVALPDVPSGDSALKLTALFSSDRRCGSDSPTMSCVSSSALGRAPSGPVSTASDATATVHTSRLESPDAIGHQDRGSALIDGTQATPADAASTPMKRKSAEQRPGFDDTKRSRRAATTESPTLASSSLEQPPCPPDGASAMKMTQPAVCHSFAKSAWRARGFHVREADGVVLRNKEVRLWPLGGP